MACLFYNVFSSVTTLPAKLRAQLASKIGRKSRVFKADLLSDLPLSLICLYIFTSSTAQGGGGSFGIGNL